MILKRKLSVLLLFLAIAAISASLSAAGTNVFVTKTWVDLPKEDFRIKDGYRIPLHLTEPSGVARASWPVTTGVPIPRGIIFSAEQCRLTDEAGHELPLQTRALAHWPDSSVKWLLLDFQITLKANEGRTLSLYVGQSDPDSLFVSKELRHTVHHPTPIRLTDIPGGIKVDTGALTFNVLSNRFSFLENGAILGQGIGARGDGFVELRDRLSHSVSPRGGEYLASLARNVEVQWEENGPIRAVVKITCQHESPDGRISMPMTLRLEAYAGKSYVRVYHTFVMSENPGSVTVPQMGLLLALGIDKEAGRVAMDRAGPESKAGTTSILNDAWNHCAIQSAKGKTHEITGPVRWLDYSDDSKGLTVFVRDMERLYPKELKADADAGTVVNYIWPADLGRDMDMRVELLNPSPGMLDYQAKYPERWRMSEHGGITPEEAAKKGYGAKGKGVAKTHEFFYYFHMGDAEKAESAKLCQAFNQPLVGYVTPQWYSFTEAIGRFHPYDPTNFPALEQYMSRHLNWILKHQNEWSLWFGMFDYGDIQTQRTDIPGQWSRYVDRWGWLNTEAYVDSAAWMQYLRTGRREYYDFAEAMQRHHVDVDTIHYALGDPEHDYIGGSMRHDINHWGGQISPEQTWSSGSALYYYLTGYMRALDVVKLHAKFGESFLKKDWAMGRAMRDTVNGWRSAFRVWEATGDSHYKETADQFAEGYRERQLNSGMWDETQFTYMGHAVAEWYYMTGNEDCRQILRRMKDVRSVNVINESLSTPAPFTAYQYWLTRDPVYLIPGYRQIIQAGNIPTFDNSELGVDDFKSCRIMMLEGLPYFMAALYDARADLHRFLPRVRKVPYQPDDPIEPLPKAQFQVVDLSGVANANPYVNTFHLKDEDPVPSHITVYLKDHPLRPLRPGEIGFQFGSQNYPRVPGYILATENAKYPFSENTPFPGQNLYGPPFGAVATYGGVPFALANPETGKAAIVLDKSKRARISVNQAAQRVHFLGHVHYRSSYPTFDSLKEEVVARYIIHYAGGKDEIIDLRNNHEIDDMRSPTYADRVRLAYIGPSGMHLNSFSHDLLPHPVKSIEFIDMDTGLNPVLLAVTLEGGSFPPAPAAIRRFLFKAPPPVAPLNPAVRVVAADALYTEKAAFGWVNQMARTDPKYSGWTILKGEHHFRAALPNGLYELRFVFPNQGGATGGRLDLKVQGESLLQNASIVTSRLVVPALVTSGNLDIILTYHSGRSDLGAEYLLMESLEIAPARTGLFPSAETPVQSVQSHRAYRLRFGWDTPPALASWTYAGLQFQNTMNLPATFSVDLPSGHYACELRLSASWPGDPLAVDVFAEDAPVATALSLGSETIIFETDVKDGRLDIRIVMNKEKTNTRNPAWEVQSLVITPKTEHTT